MQADATMWETLARTAGGLILMLIGAYTGMVHRWHNSRFASAEKRLDENEKKTADHDVKMAEFGAHMENAKAERKEIKDSIRALHKKIDNLGNVRAGGN